MKILCFLQFSQKNGTNAKCEKWKNFEQHKNYKTSQTGQ